MTLRVAAFALHQNIGEWDKVAINWGYREFPNRGNDDASRRFVLADNPALTSARLALARGIGQIIRNGLGVMGVEPVEEMH